MHPHIDLDRMSDTVAKVREAILDDLSPLEIAQMICMHFQIAPEDILDTAQALIQGYIRAGYYLSPDKREAWIVDAFNV